MIYANHLSFDHKFQESLDLNYSLLKQIKEGRRNYNILHNNIVWTYLLMFNYQQAIDHYLITADYFNNKILVFGWRGVTFA